MPTLDEVIRAIEVCRDSYVAGKIIKSDALYYLKEYRTLQYGYIKAMVDLEDNQSLTWDELKTMEGKPVWVEVYDPIDEKTGWHTASWKLIEFINDEYFDVRDSNGEQECFYKSENDWQAYRKERE